MVGSPPLDRAGGGASEWDRHPGTEDSKPMRLSDSGRSFRAFAGLLAWAVLSIVASTPGSTARAALIATGTGAGNTTAPTPDPGFGRVGVVNGLSGVYFRNGWVLTANHVGTGPFWLGGMAYQPVADSTVWFENPDSTRADLIAFKLKTRPPVADVALPDGPPGVNTLLTVIGYGFDRGAPTTWMGVDGWSWAGTRSMRWGTNRISAVGLFALDTEALQITFDDLTNPANGEHEADVVVGDSGGGAFTGSGNATRLVGILFARGGYVGQPTNTSLFGNVGLIVDLHAYRDDLLAVVDRPDCSDGLDDDGDGLTDHPADLGCSSPTDTSERSSVYICDNGLDDDGDQLSDFPSDPGCVVGLDLSEKGTTHQCDNGLDDDGDRHVDFPNDPGCLHPSNAIEAPEPGLGLAIGTGVFALAGAQSVLRRRSVPAQTSSTRSTR